MKDVVQIKAELFEHQHDALMTFYDTYPRLFVNKLLLRLCEGCIPDYPPSLAQFTTSAPSPGAKKRKVVIRLSKSLSPAFWVFYKDLPYGARSVVIINLMNHYAQLAEADKRLMERVYWSGAAAASSVVLPNSEPAITSPRASGEQAVVTKPASTSELANFPARGSGTEVEANAVAGANSLGGNTSGSDLEEQDDPLSRVEVSL